MKRDFDEAERAAIEQALAEGRVQRIEAGEWRDALGFQWKFPDTEPALAQHSRNSAAGDQRRARAHQASQQ